MSTKRPHSSVHPSRHGQVPAEPKRKKQKPANAGPQSFKKAHPINDLKSQIRSLKRLLSNPANDALPPGVRVEKERALATAEYELAATQRAKERKDMIGKWHKIRFFDRQKATKRLKRLRKEVETAVDARSKEELVRKVDEAQVAVNYAQYFPLDMDYVPLFPSRRTKKDGEEDQGSDGSDDDTKRADRNGTEREGDEEMWRRVQQCMVDGTLDTLRNGKLTRRHDTVGEEERESKSVDWKKRKPGALSHSASTSDKKLNGAREKSKSMAYGANNLQAEDEESDGGFFE